MFGERQTVYLPMRGCVIRTLRATYGATVTTVRKARAKSCSKSAVSDFLVPYGAAHQVCQHICDFSLNRTRKPYFSRRPAPTLTVTPRRDWP